MIRFIFLLLILLASCSKKSVFEIPEPDRSSLVQFFRRVLFDEGLIYVLSGSKPMGTACYTSSLIPDSDSDESNQIIKNGWHTWRKYEHFFPTDKLMFKSIGNEENDVTIKLILINKTEFRKVITQNLQVFEESLGYKIDVTKIIKNFEIDEDPIQHILQKNELLIGILHGFGVHNSKLFVQRAEQIEKMRAALNFSCLRDMPEESLIEAGLHAEILETPNHPILNLPMFSADPNDPETDELRCRYQKERRKIIDQLEGQDLFEFVFNFWK